MLLEHFFPRGFAACSEAHAGAMLLPTEMQPPLPVDARYGAAWDRQW